MSVLPYGYDMGALPYDYDPAALEAALTSPLLTHQTSDLMAAVIEIRDRHPGYARSLAYYAGEVAEVHASPAVHRALRGEVAGFDVNLARRPVDAVLDRMRIVSVSVPDDEGATRWLVDEVCTPNRFDRLSKRVHRHAAAQGDAYITVWPNADGQVRMHFNGPGTTRVFYSEEDEQVKEYAARLWCEGRGDQRVHRCDLYYPDRIERYVTEHGKKGDEAVEWERYADSGDGVWPLPNPYGVVPIFHFRTDEPYGRPLHKGAFGAQNAITKLSATLMATIDFQGFPQRYKLLHPPSPTDVSANAIDWDGDDTTNPGDAASALKAGAGTIWDLDAKAVGQFDPADVEAFLKPLSFYARAMAASTATPLRFFEPSGDVPSGESLRADDAPLTHRIADLAELFGEVWQEVLAFAAVAAGSPLPTVDVQWSPVQTVDDETGWRTVKAKQDAGVPVRQTLTEAGYLSDLVEGWQQESDTSSLAQRLAMLEQVGQALQSLGNAAALGVVDKATVATIIAQTLGDLVRDGADVAAVSPEVLARMAEDEKRRQEMPAPAPPDPSTPPGPAMRHAPPAPPPSRAGARR